MLNVREEIEGLLAEMRAKASTIDDARDTMEVAAIARQMALPVLADDTPPSFIPALARATLLGAWVQHDAMRHLQRLAA